MEGEHGTCPMPEEEATLLGGIKLDIQSDVKPDIEVPQVPELLEIHEQAQPAEQTITPTASPPFPHSPPGLLPSPKAKKSQSRTTGADAIGAAQWVHSYLKDNFRLLFAMNCCYCGDPSPSAAMHSTAVLRSQPVVHHLLPTEGTVLAHFGLLQLQPAPSMHQGPALLKAMQVCQILIQIAVWQASHLQLQ